MPRPSRDSTSTVPPWRCMISRTMPRPRPGARTLERVLVGRAEQRREQVGLVGLGDADALVAAGEGDRRRRRRARPRARSRRPASEYFTALSTRLLIAPATSRASAWTIAGPGSPDEVEGDAGLLRHRGHRAERLVDDRHRGRSRVIVGGCCGSLTRDSIARPSSRSPSRSRPAQDRLRAALVALVDVLARGEELGVGGDHGHRVVDLVGQLAQEPVPGLLELAQLLEQPPLALRGVGVGDRAAEVVAELEGGHALAVGPAARAGAARAPSACRAPRRRPRRARRRPPRSPPRRGRGRTSRRARPPAPGRPRCASGSMMRTRWSAQARAAAASSAWRTSGAICRPEAVRRLDVLVEEDVDLQLVDRQRAEQRAAGLAQQVVDVVAGRVGPRQPAGGPDDPHVVGELLALDRGHHRAQGHRQLVGDLEQPVLVGALEVGGTSR